MKTYINAVFINEVNNNGTQRLKFSGKLDEIIKELKSIETDKGYINLFIQKRQNPTEHSTHYLYNFKPDQNNNSSNNQNKDKKR